MRTCSGCLISKQDEEFYLSDVGSRCKECKRESSAIRYRKNQADFYVPSRIPRDTLDEKRLAKKQEAALRRKRYATDPKYRLVAALRTRLSRVVKFRHGVRGGATFELLGCPWVWLEVHLESLFKPGMTWENYGPVWHIDHIRPVSSFPTMNPEEQKACFHWTNLQPLFAEENLIKSDSYEAS